MVEEAQRSAYSEAVQPQRQLGEFDRHRVLVDAVDDALEDDAADQALVVKLRGRYPPAVRLSPRENAGAHFLEVVEQRRAVTLNRLRCFGNRVEHLARQIVDKADEEMSTAHRGVDDAQRQEGGGGVELLKPAVTIFGILLLARRIGDGIGKRLALIVEQRADGLAQYEHDERFRRVVTAAGLARERLQPRRESACAPTGAIHDEVVFEQALIDAAEMLDGKVAVVDEARPVARALAR